MKNKYISIILLALFVGIGIFGYNSYIKLQEKQKQIELRKQEEKAKKDKEIESDLKTAEVTPVLNTSGSLTDNKNQIKDTLHSTQDDIEKERISILTFSSIAQCSSLTYLKDECKEQFLYNLAKKRNDLEYCDRLKSTSEINNCKDEISYTNNKCDTITDTYLKSKCEYNAKQTASHEQKEAILSSKDIASADVCKTLSNYGEKETCLKKLILKTNTINLCGTFFTSKDEQSKCYKNVSYDFNRNIISQAYETKNLTLCDKITDATVKNQCKSMKF